ncbi:MAG: glycosyl hydrolase family 17 protein, partial [Phycisphaerae bacterium]|nr:glycosyl hydrolase family 17 protein [Phycisphaerae bacterium]
RLCCRKVITRDFQWPHATVSHKHYRLMTTLYNRRAGRSIFSMGIKLLRTYNTQNYPQTSRMLQAIRQLKDENPDFEMVVMLGAWITCKGAHGPAPDHSKEDFAFNKREIDTAIEMAHQYPDIIKIIAVGNEAMVTWQAHFVPAATILKWVNTLKEARTSGRMPAKTLVTTSDNWAALGGQKSYHNDDLLELLKQVDFVSLHTYAFHDTYYDPALKWAAPAEEADLPMTEQAARAVKRAIAHQVAQYDAVNRYLRENGIKKDIHIGETGWASLDDSFYGNDGTCAASEYNAKLFYNAVRKWTTESNLTCFYFEAFDEPWKSDSPDGSEGHFGLFTVDGKAKYALWDLVDAGVFDGLTRGGNAIVKTHDGRKEVLLKKLKAPALKKHR